MKWKIVSCVFVLALLIGTFGSIAAAEEHTALRVVTVHTDDVGAYVKEIERGKAILKRLDSHGIIRVWMARYAGDASGTVVVSIEYPNLETLAAEETKISADAEYTAWLKGLDKLRKIVSDSIYYEMKP
jgi:hypothetical protein